MDIERFEGVLEKEENLLADYAMRLVISNSKISVISKRKILNSQYSKQKNFAYGFEVLRNHLFIYRSTYILLDYVNNS